MTNRRRSLVGYLSAEAIGLMGTRLSMIALPWFVLMTTGSAAKTGLVAFCEMAPYAVAKLLSGPVIDRVGARRVSVLADIVSAPVIGLVPVLHGLGWLDFSVLLPLVAITGMARGPGDTAKAALVPGIADAAEVPLANVTGMAGTVQRLADTVGPALAGVLIVWIGPTGALALNAVTFALSGLLIRLTVAEQAHSPQSGESDDEPYLTRLRQGFRFVVRDRLLLMITVMIAVTNLLDAAVMSVLLPVWAVESGAGPAGIGTVWAAVSITAVVGSLTAATFAHRLPRRTTFLVAFLIGGAPRIAILAVGLPVWVVIAVWAVSGLALGLLNPILSATQYERIPKHLLGRVSAVISTSANAGVPIGGLAGGLLLSGTGLGPTVLVCAALYLVATTVPALRPEWRSMEPAGGAGHVGGDDDDAGTTADDAGRTRTDNEPTTAR
jgi:MFS family permease